jgi:hypothetical protein
MPKLVLLDESIPAGVKRILSGFDVKTVPEMGWAGISNGKLLDLVEQARFDLLVTADANIKFQNQLSGRRIAMAVLISNRWKTIREHADELRKVVASIHEGDYVTSPAAVEATAVSSPESEMRIVGL